MFYIYFQAIIISLKIKRAPLIDIFVKEQYRRLGFNAAPWRGLPVNSGLILPPGGASAWFPEPTHSSFNLVIGLTSLHREGAVWWTDFTSYSFDLSFFWIGIHPFLQKKEKRKNKALTNVDVMLSWQPHLLTWNKGITMQRTCLQKMKLPLWTCSSQVQCREHDGR